MPAKPKKPHPEDALLAAQIAKATRFSASIRYGRFDKQTRYVEQAGRDGYAAALAAAAQLDATSQYGRRAVVYAINALGSFPVDAKLARLAGLAS